MNRPTKKIKTPVQGHDVELYEYMTGGDKRIITSAGTDMNKQLEAMVKQIVVSIDGKTEDCMAIMDQMHGKDSDFIFIEITNIISESNLTPEKKSN